MRDFSSGSFLENLKERFTGKRKYFAYLSCSLIMLTVVALVIFIVQKAHKPKQIKRFERSLVMEQELVVPDGPHVQRGYITSRETQQQWSEEDIERWLTLPSTKELGELQTANDKLVSDIVGAVP